MKNRIPSATAHHVWLPKEIYGTTLDELRKNVNFYIGRTTEENVEIIMPMGWFMAHDPAGGEWLYIFDHKGRKRAVITRNWRKVADDEAITYTMHWLRRFGVDVWMHGLTEGNDAPTSAQWYVIDSDGTVVHSGELIPIKSRAGMVEHLDAIDAGIAWLFENKPDWQDYFAYWDE